MNRKQKATKALMLRSPKVTYREMVWLSKEGNILIKRMDTNHIRNTIKAIENYRGQSISGYHPSVWIKAMKAELNHRDHIADTILKRVPDLFEWTCRVLANDRVFSTKHLK